MKHLEPILASVLFSLLLLAGILALESSKDVFGPSAGAAVAVAALSAYFVVYDMMKRDGVSLRAKPGDKTKASADVTPRIPSDAMVVVDAVLKSEKASSSIQKEIDGVMAPTPVALRIIFPPPSTQKNDFFEGDHLLEQLKVLDAKFKTDFRFVYFVKANKNFLGFCPAKTFMQMLDQSESRRAIILLINNGQEDQFLKESWVESTSIDSTSSNSKALQFLATQQKTSAMIVKANTQRPLGVIDWATLVQRVLSAVG